MQCAVMIANRACLVGGLERATSRCNQRVREYVAPAFAAGALVEARADALARLEATSASQSASVASFAGSTPTSARASPTPPAGRWPDPFVGEQAVGADGRFEARLPRAPQQSAFRCAAASTAIRRPVSAIATAYPCTSSTASPRKPTVPANGLTAHGEREGDQRADNAASDAPRAHSSAVSARNRKRHVRQIVGQLVAPRCGEDHDDPDEEERTRDGAADERGHRQTAGRFTRNCCHEMISGAISRLPAAGAAHTECDRPPSRA
jgi:hypothetical protein